MGYNIQPNAPQFKVGNETYALGAFLWNGGPVGTIWTVGLYRQDAAQGWIVVQQYQPSGGCLTDMKAKGGRVAYQNWIKQLFNNWFAATFKPAPPPTGEPATDEEAQAMIAAFVNALNVTVANGVPSV